MQPDRCSRAGVLSTILLGVLFATVVAKDCKSDYDVCVVGAGGSGAFTAVKLKQKGHKVLVLEKDNRVSHI